MIPLDYEKNLPSLVKHIKVICTQRRTSLARLSKQMGRNSGYYAYTLRKKNLPILTLLELTALLGANFLEPYTLVLPSTLRGSKREKELLKEVEKLKKEMRALKAENERLWGRVG